MKFTTQTTFALISIVLFLAVSVYTLNTNYLIAGFFFTFIFMPSEPKEKSGEDTKIKNNNQITK